MKVPDNTTQDLLKRVAEEADEKAFEVLFHKYVKRLMHFTRYITKTGEAAEEITLDVFNILWQQREKLRHVTDFEAYIFMSAKNASLNYLTKIARQPLVSIETINSDLFRFPDNPEEQLISREKYDAIRIAISNLPPKCGLIFEMIYMDGLKYKDVAAVLDLSVKTVEAQMAIALKKITHELKQSKLF